MQNPCRRRGRERTEILPDSKCKEIPCEWRVNDKMAAQHRWSATWWTNSTSTKRWFARTILPCVVSRL